MRLTYSYHLYWRWWTWNIWPNERGNTYYDISNMFHLLRYYCRRGLHCRTVINVAHTCMYIYIYIYIYINKSSLASSSKNKGFFRKHDKNSRVTVANTVNWTITPHLVSFQCGMLKIWLSYGRMLLWNCPIWNHAITVITLDFDQTSWIPDITKMNLRGLS